MTAETATFTMAVDMDALHDRTVAAMNRALPRISAAADAGGNPDMIEGQLRQALATGLMLTVSEAATEAMVALCEQFNPLLDRLAAEAVATLYAPKNP